MSLSFGISPALVTPFSGSGVDVRRLADHARDCLARGCRTATIFGTTGEGPSVGAGERDRVAAELIGLGIPAAQLVEGVIASSIEEAVYSTGRALQRGAHAVLLAPPFYFRPAPDDALFAWYAAVFEAVGRDCRDVILYHIPGMTGVPLPHGVIRRLVEAFPGAVRGVKDSAGDAEATFALIEAFPDLSILVGDETYLGRACAAGAAGSICGVANIAPEAVVALAENGRDDPRIVELVREITAHPVIPMVKALVAHVRQDRAWAFARPPLPTIDEETAARVAKLLDPAVVALAENGRDDPRIVALVEEITRHPVIPMVKALVAHVRQDRAWAAARPPLPTIDEETAARVAKLLDPFKASPKAVA